MQLVISIGTNYRISVAYNSSAQIPVHNLKFSVPNSAQVNKHEWRVQLRRFPAAKARRRQRQPQRRAAPVQRSQQAGIFNDERHQSECPFRCLGRQPKKGSHRRRVSYCSEFGLCTNNEARENQALKFCEQETKNSERKLLRIGYFKISLKLT